MVMAVTVVSKILGFLRDIVLAYYYGTSLVTDAFFVAQTIPEFLFILVVQTISIGFIPVYVRIAQKQDENAANEFTNKILKLCMLLSILLIIFVNLFATEIVTVFASGFTGEKAALTVGFTRIIVFSMFFRIIVAVYSAYLNANSRFLKPAMNGVILDVVSIIAIIVSFYTSSVVIVFGTIAATFLQFMSLFTTVVKMKPIIRPSFRGMIDDNVKQMIALLLPVALGVGASQINVLADRTMASSIPGAISSLNYANKVNNVLENIIIFSLSTVIFPAFSRCAASGDLPSLKKQLNKSMDVVSVTMIPCSCVSFVFSSTIIQILFERGAFGVTAIENSAAAMRFYSIGLLFLSYNAIMNRALYALKKVRQLSYISCGTVAVNIGMNFLLKPVMGIGGLALATSISNIFATFAMMYLIVKELGDNKLEIKTEIVKAVAASGGMILAMLVNMRILSHINTFFAFCISGALGVMAFIATEYLLKSELIVYSLVMVKESVTKKRKKS